MIGVLGDLGDYSAQLSEKNYGALEKLGVLRFFAS